MSYFENKSQYVRLQDSTGVGLISSGGVLQVNTARVTFEQNNLFNNVDVSSGQMDSSFVDTDRLSNLSIFGRYTASGFTAGYKQLEVEVAQNSDSDASWTPTGTTFLIDPLVNTSGYFYGSLNTGASFVRLAASNTVDLSYSSNPTFHIWATVAGK